MSPLNKECQLPCDLILCISDSVVMSLSKLWEMVKDRVAWHAAVHGVAKSWNRQSN